MYCIILYILLNLVKSGSKNFLEQLWNNFLFSYNNWINQTFYTPNAFNMHWLLISSISSAIFWGKLPVMVPVFF